MKIDVGTVQQQLNSENNELSNSMQSTYEVLPDILEFIRDRELSGMAYNQFKGHMADVTQSLVQAIVGSNGTTLDQSTVNNVGEMYQESKAFIDEMLSKMGNS